MGPQLGVPRGLNKNVVVGGDPQDRPIYDPHKVYELSFVQPLV